MGNVLDNELVLEAVQGLIAFRNLSSEVDVLQFYWYAGDPNGVLTAPAGSIVSGTAGTWRNTNGSSAWSEFGGLSDYFQMARDPLYATTEIYISPTGSDSGPNDGSIGLPFATLARAIQSVPVMRTSGYIAFMVAAGTYSPMPSTLVFPERSYVQGADRTVVASYTVDAATPVNTVATGNRIVLNTTALAATVPDGTFLNVTTTAPGGVIPAIVYRSDNSDPGGKLVVWVTSWYADTVVNVAAGAAVDVMSDEPVVFEFDSGTRLVNADIYYCRLQTLGGALIRRSIAVENCFFAEGTIKIGLTPSGDGASVGNCYLTRAVAWYGPAKFDSTSSVYHTVNYPISLAAGIYAQGPGPVSLGGENAFLGQALAIGVTRGGATSSDTAVLRAVDLLYFGVTPGTIFAMNQSDISGRSTGGDSFIGTVVEPQTLLGVPIPCNAATVVNVEALSNTQVVMAAGSNVTLGGILNKVTISGALQASDASGTRLVGGTPAPGGWGPSVQRVTATGQTWDGVSATVVLISNTIGPGGTFSLMATDRVSTGARVMIKNEDGVNAVAITPDVLGSIDGGGAGVPLALGGGGSKANAVLVNESIVAATARNWMTF
jgi:hypothetical protein